MPSSNGAALGDWSVIAPPYEIVACMAQQSYDDLYSRMLCDFGGPVGLLQGSAAGQVVAFGGNVSGDIALPMNVQKVVRMRVTAQTVQLIIDNGTPVDVGISAIGWNGLMIGPNSDASPAQVRFKRVLFLGRSMTSAEAAGVQAWMSA